MRERFRHPPTTVDRLASQSHEIEHPSERVWRRRRQVLAFFTLCAALYGGDVASNRLAEEHAEVTIKIIDEHALDPAFDNQAILSIGGYKSVDGTLVNIGIAEQLRQTYDGQLWMLDSGNADFNEQAVADAVTEIAQKSGVTRITIVGHSAGGILGNGVIAKLIESQDGPTVELEILASTPMGVSNLPPAQKQGLELAGFLSNFGEVSYSTPIQYATGMAFEFERIDDFESLIDAHNDTIEGIDNNTTATVALQVRQALSIVDANFDEEFEIIGNTDWTQQKPVVVYFAANGDTKVDNHEASDDVCESSHEHGIQCIQGEVPGFVSHERPDLYGDNYAEAIALLDDEITAAIESERKATLPLVRNPSLDTFPI